MDQLRFSVAEILSLIGLAQCLYVLVYMAFRSGDLKRALLPFCYFSVLGAAFFFDFSQRFLADMSVYYEIIQWFLWFMGPPLSVLLVIQIACIHKTPNFSDYGVLFVVPLAYVGAVFMALQDRSCLFPINCTVLHEWLVITGLIAGAISMAAIWGHKNMLTTLYQDKAGKDRYWLILTLVFINLLFLAVMLVSLTPVLSHEDALLIRTLLGTGVVYLAGTSLFRIYPQSLILVNRGKKEDMSAEELALAQRIEQLLDREKIYHEPSYGRAELARELEVSETIISKVINLHFGKSFPQLLNERRVEDAKTLIRDTNVPIKIIAQEAGFNSAASFNRVFRDITGQSPSDYRTSK